MLFQVQLNLIVDGIDQTQMEILALAALQAAKAEVHQQAMRVTESSANVSRPEESSAGRNDPTQLGPFRPHKR
jgi:hypothetical protein